MGFSHSLSKSPKDQVKLLFSLVNYDVSSQTGNNLKYLREKYSLVTVEQLFEAKQMIGTKEFNEMSQEDLWKIDVLEDLIEFRTHSEDTELLKEEIEDLISFITTS